MTESISGEDGKGRLDNSLPCSFKSMEVNRASTAESELRLRHCSSDQAVSIFADAPEGRTITFCAKSANLTDNWNVAFATKKVDHFEVFFEKDPENKLIFNNDDESKSLLTSNLWEIGWYSLVEENQHLPCSFKPMEVNRTSTAESELRLRHCSSDQAVSIFADAPEGRTITFCAKSANLTDNWNVAFATKKVDHFEVFF